MKLIQTFSICLLMSMLRAQGALPRGWNTNSSEVLSQAAKGNEPALIFFTASWCGPCQLMARLTLENPEVDKKLSNLKHVAVDIDENRDFAAKFGINAVPTFILLAGDGEETKRSTGFQKVDEFMSWITNGVSAAKETETQHALQKQRLSTIDTLIQSAKPGENGRAAQELFELCCVRDASTLQEVSARLQKLAEIDPLALLPGLNDQRLPTRISVANALRARLGETFEVDAWADSSTRAKAAESWRLKLSTGKPL